MKFTRIVYGIAAAYGFISLLPLYLMIDKVGHDAPPAITHPEFYYGFLGLGLLWQFAFVPLSRDPLRYRNLMPITILEKFVYTVPVVLLYLNGRVSANIMWPSLVDPIFGILFIAAFVQTTAEPPAGSATHFRRQNMNPLVHAFITQLLREKIDAIHPDSHPCIDASEDRPPAQENGSDGDGGDAE